MDKKPLQIPKTKGSRSTSISNGVPSCQKNNVLPKIQTNQKQKDSFYVSDIQVKITIKDSNNPY